MNESIFHLIGGIGIFLLGMSVMTDGLKGLAGESLHRILTRFTHSPSSGVATGAITTAILQSSSATTVAAVGFVGAGLLTFPQAIGIIFGANLGTTITGWMVALLGFKLQIGQLLLPVIAVGSLLHLFSSGKYSSIGYSLAGFGLIFVGISMLQEGMQGFQGVITPADFPDDNFTGRLLLIGFGMLVTIITQSSSAGVATAMTALYAGTINFPQAAAMVIGMDVGTTATALFATIGGSTETRRTGYSHVIYNLLTALGAFLLLSPYVYVWQTFLPGELTLQPEIALVAFHSLFNGIGVLIILPFTHLFSALLYKLVPARKYPLIDKLDKQALAEPIVALTLVGHAVQGLYLNLLKVSLDVLSGHSPKKQHLNDIALQLDTVHVYLDEIHLKPDESPNWHYLTHFMHCLDHMQRLHERCEEEPERPLALIDEQQLEQLRRQVHNKIKRVQHYATELDWHAASVLAGETSEWIEQLAVTTRFEILSDVAEGDSDVPEGTRRLEGVRWIRRVSLHIWRICIHLQAIEDFNRGQKP